MSEHLDPLLNAETRAHYMGLDPQGGILWSDDPRVAHARQLVQRHMESTYSTEDLLQQKHDAGLAQTSARVMDQWALNASEDFSSTMGYVRQDLESYAASESPANANHHALATELVRLTTAGTPYWDVTHGQHDAYLRRVTWLHEQLYNDDALGGARG